MKVTLLDLWQDCVKSITEKSASFLFTSVNLNWMGQTPREVELEFEVEWLWVEFTEMQFKDIQLS